MERTKTYHKGILFWVDDSFIHHPFEKDIDIWVKLFGNESDKIFRLMDLKLKIATTYEKGKEMIDDLVDQEKQGVYVFCILDLYIPRNKQTEAYPSSVHGIKLANLVQDKGFNFVFLSTAVNMLGNKFSEVPFYQKKQGEQKIPETLIQLILKNFRANISWISVGDIMDELKDSSMKALSSQENKFSRNYFPFFSSFRDFVEHWESRPVLSKGFAVISRCPRAHGDPFVIQCLLVSIYSLVQRNPGKVHFRYINPKNQPFPDKIGNIPGKLNIIVLRIQTVNAADKTTAATTAKEFHELFKRVQKPDNIVYFILPNDESSEEYLDKVARDRRIIYEDLPSIRIGDSFTREALIRRSINLVFQNQVIYREDRKYNLGDIYLAHPEILVKPTSWVILSESTEIAEQLSDPFEIVDEFESALEIKLKNAPEDQINKIINGDPLKSSELLDVGMETLKKDFSEEKFEKTFNNHWLPRALRLWLSMSWHFPYGLDHNVGKTSYRFHEEKESQWEEFSLSVLMDLISQYRLNDDFVDLNMVYNFLKHNALEKLLAHRTAEAEGMDISNDDWAGLSAERWPYQKYPIPTALTKRLKNAGRSLWVDTDHFNLAQMFPSTRLHHKYLDNVVDQMGGRLRVLEKQCPYLPGEWAFYIDKFIHLIRKSRIPSAWNDKKNKEIIYHSLMDFQNNVMPISFIAYNIWCGKFDNTKERDKVFKTLATCSGFGTLINKISPLRKDNLFIFLRPTIDIFVDSKLNALQNFSRTLDLNNEYRSAYRLNKLVEELKRKGRLDKIYKEMPRAGKKRLAEILAIDDPGDNPTSNLCTAKLGNLDRPAKIKLFQFMRERKEQDGLSCLFNEFDSLCANNDMWGIFNGFVKEIQEQFSGQLTPSPRDIFQKHIDLISAVNKEIPPLPQVNGKDNVSESRAEAQKCINYGGQFNAMSASPFDTFCASLNAVEKLKMIFKRMNYYDGFHFVDQLRWLRNEGKDVVPDKEAAYIEMIFELFCFGCEALIAQLKFLLELSGEKDKADKIELKYVEPIKLPPGVTKPETAVLKEFYEVIDAAPGSGNPGGGYSVYHLGIPGDQTKKAKAIRKNKENILLNKN